jgi:pimeloyl-ACP methyl ester carboxylesterase
MTSTQETTQAETTVAYADASTARVTADNGVEYAYRDLGEGDVPLVLLQHFRGNLDNWDPALVDALAAGRHVVTFDDVGVGATTGTTPNTIEAMAHDAVAFLEAMKFERVDLLGFSIGSFVAQEMALIRPALLRRVVLASSAPRGAAGRVRAIGLPVFVANGESDPMILPRYSYLLAGLLPNARLTIYPDSAHGFLFQHHSQFAADVHAFLGEAE